jgi:Ferritin-like domain
LTLEHLESTFYSQGFSKFADSDFAAAGLTPEQITELKLVGQTEATHVTVLSGVLQQLGQTPVQPCNYNFGLTDAKSMLGLARVLEAVGISA